MAPMKINDLLAYVSDNKAPTALTEAVDASVNGVGLDQAVTRANARGTVDATTAAFSHGGLSSADILRRQEAVESLEARLTKGGKELTPRQATQIAETKAALKRDTEKLYGHMADSSHFHTEVINQIDSRQAAVVEQLGRARDARIEKLEGMKIAAGADEARIAKIEQAITNVNSRHDNAVAHVTEHYTNMTNTHQSHIKDVEHTTGRLETKTGHSSAGAATVAGATGAAAKGAGKIATALSKEAKEMGIVGETAFKEQGWIKRQLGAAKANWNVSAIDETSHKITQAGNMGRFARVAGTGVGAVLGGYGLKDLGQVVGVVSPDVDDQGKEIPADSGKLFKAAAELGAGAALVYVSLLKGGHGKAMTNIAHL